MEGNCQINDVVYNCDITRPLPRNILNLQRRNGRATSITTSYDLNTRYSNKTTLSSYMWHLKGVSSERPNLK